MKLEILGAEEKDDKYVLKIDYDWEFCSAIAKVCGVKYATEQDIEDFIIYVLNDMDTDDLEQMRDEVDE